MLWLLLSCQSEEKGPEIVPRTEETGTEPTWSDALPSLLEIGDDNIARYEAIWNVGSTEIAVGEHLIFSWDGLTADASGAERPADGFPLAELLRLGTDLQGLESALALDDLDAVVLDRFVTEADGLTELHTSRFDGFSPSAFSPDDTEIWLFVLEDRESEPLVALALSPAPSQEGTLVTVGEGISSVSRSFDLDRPELVTASGRSDYSADWSLLTLDGYGRPYDPSRAVELFVGRYDSAFEPDDLTSEIEVLQASASAWWSAQTEGRSSAELSELAGTGGAFPGFQPDVVYLVGAREGGDGEAPLWVAGVSVR